MLPQVIDRHAQAQEVPAEKEMEHFLFLSRITEIYLKNRVKILDF